MLLIVILILVMYEDYSIFAVILSVSLHFHSAQFDLYHENKHMWGTAQIAVLFALYAVHYYLIFLGVFRPLYIGRHKTFSQKGGLINKRIGKNFEWFWRFFYVVDVPSATYLVLTKDEGIFNILKYHLLVKFCMLWIMTTELIVYTNSKDSNMMTIKQWKQNSSINKQ